MKSGIVSAAALVAAGRWDASYFLGTEADEELRLATVSIRRAAENLKQAHRHLNKVQAIRQRTARLLATGAVTLHPTP